MMLFPQDLDRLFFLSGSMDDHFFQYPLCVGEMKIIGHMVIRCSIVHMLSIQSSLLLQIRSWAFENSTFSNYLISSHCYG